VAEAPSFSVSFELELRETAISTRARTRQRRPCGAALEGLFDTDEHVERYGGGAAGSCSPERRRRGGRAAADGVARRDNATEQEGEGKGVPEHHKLTRSRMEATAMVGAAGIDGDGIVAGGRTRRGTGCPRRLGSSPADSFGQEGRGGEAEPRAASAELGDDRSSRAKRRP
jgi:hypothetical protein